MILISRDIGCHGATIFAAREGIELSNDIQSDCASLYPIVQRLVNEDKIPVSQAVNGMCEMLGFEAMSLANEGTFCLAIKKEDSKKALKILQEFNTNATILGKVTQKYKQKVILNSAYGTQRFLETPTGELLPRIC